MKKLIIILFIAAAFEGCYYDVEEDLYPVNGDCDTVAVSFSTTVLPILQNNGCISCHSGGAPSGNISLGGYNEIKAMSLNGKLYGSINHQAGFSPMPKGGNKMSDCNIRRVKAWIDAGANQN